MATNKKKVLIALITTIAILIVIVGAFFIYCGVYYHADENAVNNFVSTETCTREEISNNLTIFKGVSPVIGIIFYPGAKVETKAYEPLMASLAKQGIICVLVKMPLNLAFFNINAADGIKEKYPEVKRWFLMGHSLGGVMAANYLSKHIDEYEGIILLASYSTKDISNSRVISIYGSEDKVLNKKNYEKYKNNLPKNYNEFIVEGGCHSYFGMYGLQRGDGNPKISVYDQIDWTSMMILSHI